jgi:hypothetical protein
MEVSVLVRRRLHDLDPQRSHPRAAWLTGRRRELDRGCSSAHPGHRRPDLFSNNSSSGVVRIPISQVLKTDLLAGVHRGRIAVFARDHNAALGGLSGEVRSSYWMTARVVNRAFAHAEHCTRQGSRALGVDAPGLECWNSDGAMSCADLAKASLVIKPDLLVPPSRGPARKTNPSEAILEVNEANSELGRKRPVNAALG